MSALPGWIRALLAVDRLVARGHRIHEVLRDELLRSFVAPEARTLVTDLAYSRECRRYAPGGSVFSWGLLPWEQRALSRMALRPGDRILLGGAGGGRELQGLLELGYAVDAFEPQPRLYAAAEALAGDRAAVHQGGYGDLPQAVQRRGPLASLRGPYAAVVFGWGSFSHITDPAVQHAALAAARNLAPQGAALLSFLGHSPVGPDVIRLRRVVAALSRRTPPDDQLRYLSHCGFYVGFSATALATLAKHSDYEVDYYEPYPYPHALLRPRSAEGKAP